MLFNFILIFNLTDMRCSEPQLLKMLTATFLFFNAKKLLGILQIFQNKMQKVTLKNFNFKIMKKLNKSD